MKHAALAAAFAFVFAAIPQPGAGGAQAATLWSEDFSGQEGKGAVGVGPVIDVAGVDWSIDVTGASLDSAADHFHVTGGLFEGRDLDGPAIWLSPVVAISGFTDLTLTGAFSELGVMEDHDFIDIEYTVNGADFMLLADLLSTGTANSLSDDWTAYALSVPLPDGAAFQLRVTMSNRANDEQLQMDALALTGAAVPLPAAAPLLLAGLAGLAALRRRG